MKNGIANLRMVCAVGVFVIIAFWSCVPENPQRETEALPLTPKATTFEPIEPPKAPARIRPTRQTRSVRVLRCIDGDTIDTEIGRVRFYGVDAPERDEACYLEARRRTWQLVGRRVTLEVSERRRDSHGRLLAYVFTQDGRSVDQILAEEGLAEAWRRDGHHRAALIRAENWAKNEGAGCLWEW